MFPKDYSFERDEIVDIWVSEGFVVPVGSKSSEDVGITYLDELRDRFLFQTDPKFQNKTRYVMHDLVHDMAVSFSRDECLVMKDLTNQNNNIMQNTVRHMSIEVSDESLTRMEDIQHLDKLHSLRFGIRFDVEITWFSQLSSILFLSLKGCKLLKLPESICELSSLRYLDISRSSIQELPEKLWCLYSLQVFDASWSSLQIINPGVTKLMNLRQLTLPLDASRALSRVSGLGNLSCLRRLSEFEVSKENGRGIDELKFMDQLNGRLSIKSLRNIESKEKATGARLVKKQKLKELVLQWRQCWAANLRSSENGVFEALRPHQGIECLEVIGFSGDRFPSWFKPKDIPKLRSLGLSHCGLLESLSIPYIADGTEDILTEDDGTKHARSDISLSNGIVSSAFEFLTALHVSDCHNLTNLEQFLTPEKLPCIKSIMLTFCRNLALIPVHSFGGFVCLRDLKILWCEKLMCPRKMVLPTSLRRLRIVKGNELDRSIPDCLETLTSLTLLKLEYCNNIKCIPLNSIRSNTLKCLVVDNCPELSSIGGLHALASIQHVQLSDCPKLTEVQQPFEKRELRTQEERELPRF